MGCRVAVEDGEVGEGGVVFELGEDVVGVFVGEGVVDRGVEVEEGVKGGAGLGWGFGARGDDVDEGGEGLLGGTRGVGTDQDGGGGWQVLKRGARAGRGSAFGCSPGC